MPFCAPQLVYSNSWLNQSSAIASANIFTPPSAGIFRITVLVSADSDAGPSPAVEVDIFVTDAVGQVRDLSTAALPAGSGGSASIAFSFSLDNTSTADLSTVVSGFSGTPNYNVYITIEQLA